MMEALRGLAEVQTMLSFMDSREISSGNVSSDRFLASFLIFMVRSQSAEIYLEEKLNLIAECLPKLSAGLLEEAGRCFAESGRDCCVEGVGGFSASNAVGEKEEEMAVVGLDAMQRASSTLEDFCRSYFMFHGMDVNDPRSLFRFLPVLYFSESYIYQLDNYNEIILNRCNRSPSDECDNQLMKIFQSDPFRPLCHVLEQCGLMTDRIRRELESGVEYWSLERLLCNSLSLKQHISLEDVMRAIYTKSFDYRILSLLLYKLSGQEVNESHMEFLSVSEFLVEVADDLFDYEDDIVRNNFNILRMFSRLYGAALAPSMLAKHIAEAEEQYDFLLKKLDPHLASNYQRRCEEATKEGGKISGHSLGTWNIPRVITDEESFRSNFWKAEGRDSSS